MPYTNPINRLIETGIVLKCPHKFVNASIMKCWNERTNERTNEQNIYLILLYRIKLLRSLAGKKETKEFKQVHDSLPTASKTRIKNKFFVIWPDRIPITGPPSPPPSNLSKTDKKLLLFSADLHLSLTLSFISRLPFLCYLFYRLFKIPPNHIKLMI